MTPRRHGFAVRPGGVLVVVTTLGAMALGSGCIMRRPVPEPGAVVVGSVAPAESGDEAPPPAPLAAPTPAVRSTGNASSDRFLALWTDLHQMKNGYFSPEGIPYHAAEPFIVEAPDHGHETTSE